MRLLLEGSTRQPWTWMMVSEIEVPYAENIQGLVQTLVPESLLRTNKEQRLDQSSSSYYQVSGDWWTWNSDTFPRLHQWRLHELSFAEDRIATWTSYLISNQDPKPTCKELLQVRAVEKETESSAAETNQPASRKFMHRKNLFLRIPCLGHETFAHGAMWSAMRQEHRNENVLCKRRGQAREATSSLGQTRHQVTWWGERRSQRARTPSAGRSIMKCVARTHFAWTTCVFNQQNPGDATFRDGSIDHLVSSQAFSTGWRMHHAYSLSRIAESQAVWETHRRRPNRPEWIQVQTGMWRPVS